MNLEFPGYHPDELYEYVDADFGFIPFDEFEDSFEILDCWKEPKQRTEIQELGCKLAAQILLADTLGGIVIPSEEEWIGLNLLERDDELRRKN